MGVSEMREVTGGEISLVELEADKSGEREMRTSLRDAALACCCRLTELTSLFKDFREGFSPQSDIIVSLKSHGKQQRRRRQQGRKGPAPSTPNSQCDKHRGGNRTTRGYRAPQATDDGLCGQASPGEFSRIREGQSGVSGGS